MKHYMPPLIGYHGCNRDVAELVLSGNQELNLSENDYDWLGRGIYFWVDSFERAYSWAKNNHNITNPYVIGAFIYPKNCLNLTDIENIPLLKEAYKTLSNIFLSAGVDMPQNRVQRDGIFLVRKLDCAVINLLHDVRKENIEPSFDSVYGIFEEGDFIYPNSALKEKTHAQIAILNSECIIGYFRPKELSIKESN